MKLLCVFVVLLLLLLVFVLVVFVVDVWIKLEKLEKIFYGVEVMIIDYLVFGKIVIFDFMSEFCLFCWVIVLKLDVLYVVWEDIVVVKVDINCFEYKGIDWKLFVV